MGTAAFFCLFALSLASSCARFLFSSSSAAKSSSSDDNKALSSASDWVKELLEDGGSTGVADVADVCCCSGSD